MNGVLLQGFHWFFPAGSLSANKRRLWQFLQEEADWYRAIGIDAIWIPPAYRGQDQNGVGYDVYDHYNIGEFPLDDTSKAITRYGTKDELKAAIKALHGNGNQKRVEVYADIVLNHRSGGKPNPGFWEAIRVDPNDRTNELWGEGWQRGKVEVRAYTRFDYPERGDTYSSFTWDARHFDSVDAAYELRQDGESFSEQGNYIYRFLYNEAGFDPHIKNFERWVSLEKGNFDFLTSCDFDYGRRDVREEMKAWGEWFVKEFDLDGVRLDAVKHISAGFIREWVGHVRYKRGKDLFAVAEYISGTTDTLHWYLNEVTAKGDFPQRICLFDFPLFFKFREAGRRGEDYDLRELFRNTLMEEQPALAVTFVENHDYEYGRGFQCHVEAWFKPLAYAFILLRENGFPCLFFPDYYGSQDLFEHKGYQSGRQYLDLLLKLRKQFALGEEVWAAGSTVAGWTRLGFVPGARGAMAVVINTAYNRVQSIELETARIYKLFYHLATIKWTGNGYLVVKGAYTMYGNKEEGVWTDANGRGDFVADGGAVSIWIEEGAGLE